MDDENLEIKIEQAAPPNKRERVVKAARESLNGATVAAGAIKYQVHSANICSMRLIMIKGAERLPELYVMGLGLKSARAIADRPMDEQDALIAKVLEAKERTAMELGHIVSKAVGRSPSFTNPPKRHINVRMGNCVDQLENAAELLEDFIVEVHTDNPDLPKWMARIRKVGRSLTQLTKKERNNNDDSNGGSI